MCLSTSNQITHALHINQTEVTIIPMDPILKHTAYTHFGPHIENTRVTQNPPDVSTMAPDPILKRYRLHTIFDLILKNTRVTHNPPNVPGMTSDLKEVWWSRRLEKRDTLKPK